MPESRNRGLHETYFNLIKGTKSKHYQVCRSSQNTGKTSFMVKFYLHQRTLSPHHFLSGSCFCNEGLKKSLIYLVVDIFEYLVQTIVLFSCLFPLPFLSTSLYSVFIRGPLFFGRRRYVLFTIFVVFSGARIMSSPRFVRSHAKNPSEHYG